MLDQQRRTGYIRQIWGKSRQVGATTLSLALLFWRTAFHEHYNAFTLSYDEPTSIERFDALATFMDALPDPLRPTTGYRSKSKITFEDRNSRILSGHANNPNVGAGEMNHFVHMTEAARYPHADELQTSLFPTISDAKGKNPSIVIIESTSFFGGDWFKRLGDDAIKGLNNFEFHFVPWHMHDLYTSPVPAGFQPTAEEQFLAEQHTLTLGNLVWRRKKMSEYVNNPGLFFQEYPLCLIGSMRVSTQRGIIPLVEALEGDRTESGPVLRWIPQGKAPVVKGTTKLGYQITGTPIHRIKQPNGAFIRLGEALHTPISLEPPRFAEGYHTVRWYTGPVESAFTVNEEMGRWLGYFAGDGCFSPVQGGKAVEGGQGVVSICCDAQDLDVCQDVEKLFVSVWGRAAIPRQPHRTKAVDYRSSSVNWVAPLQALGVIHRCGAAHHWKRKVCVPEAIWRSPQSVVREFLRGLYEADGHVWKGGTCMLASIHKEFLRDVQLLLLGFGITSKLEQWTQKPGLTTESWTLRCRNEESKLFSARIGFVGQRKQGRFTWPTSSLGRPKFPVMLQDMVVSIEPAGEEYVYDLTLPPPHTFSANGWCVHNSWEESWIMPKGTTRTFPDEILSYLIDHIKPGKAAWVGPEGLKFYLGGPVEVWEEPKDGIFYDLGVDPAGTAEGDWTVLQVIRRDTLEQVAQARGHWNTAEADFLDLVFWLGMAYNRAQVIPDATGGWGHTLLTDLTRRDYPNLWLNRRRDDTTGRVSNRAGFVYTKRSKSELVTNAVKTIARERPKLHSKLLVQELRDFLTIGLDEWGARTGCYDDAVNAYMLALLSATDERPRTTSDDLDRLPTPLVHPDYLLQDIDSELAGPPDMGGAMDWLTGDEHYA